MASRELTGEALERAIEALLGRVERALSDRVLRNLHDTSKALMADASSQSPTAIRSLLAATDLIGMGDPRRRWRTERRKDQKRLEGIWEKLGGQTL